MGTKFLQSAAGNQSSKRLITIIVITLFVIYFFANLFWGKVLKVSLEDTLLTIFLVSFTGVATEKIVSGMATKLEQPKLPNVPDTTNIEQVKIENK